MIVSKSIIYTIRVYRDYAIMGYMSIYKSVDLYKHAKLNKFRMPKPKRPHAAIPSEIVPYKAERRWYQIIRHASKQKRS